jgi:hypothetical protein
MKRGKETDCGRWTAVDGLRSMDCGRPDAWVDLSIIAADKHNLEADQLDLEADQADIEADHHNPENDRKGVSRLKPPSFLTHFFIFFIFRISSWIFPLIRGCDFFSFVSIFPIHVFTIFFPSAVQRFVSTFASLTAMQA